MRPDDRDLRHLRAALQAAQASIGLSDPNPRVGCVIVGDGWRAEGHTQAAGGAHAEVAALRAAAAAGHDPRGATVYVTLEPCAHHGRTPPCCDALVAAGVRRVVVAVGDPNPQVAGQGLARLRAAGIAVELADEATAREARELNIGFFSRMLRGRPWVRMKAAASLDGRTALANGASQWITGEAARADGHAWRKRAGAVLSGIGTVLADDPRLDVRHVPTALQPLRVVVDARLQTPPTARLLPPPGAVRVYHAVDEAAAPADGAQRAAALRAQGAELAALPDARGQVDLVAMLHDLGRRGVNELHVEAGERLNAALLATGMVDELLVYLAPRLLGAGRGIAALAPLERLADAPTLRWHALDRVGDDLRLLLRLPAALELDGDPA
jgi:diaminohydroxyphosphoribosylaminopyrimidine deaminase/5-amino-6-(5-phosphoribosylamino)uracil reductase